MVSIGHYNKQKPNLDLTCCGVIASVQPCPANGDGHDAIVIVTVRSLRLFGTAVAATAKERSDRTCRQVGLAMLPVKGVAAEKGKRIDTVQLQRLSYCSYDERSSR